MLVEMMYGENLDITTISKYNSNIYFLKEFLKLIIGTNLRKRKKYSRTQKHVISRYEHGWKTISNEKSLENSKNLADFIYYDSKSKKEQKYKLALIHHRLVKISEYDFSKYRPLPLLKILQDKIESDDNIVELGCGNGINLFQLQTLNLKNNLEGYELTKEGTNSAKMINNHFNCNIKFGQLDMIKELSSVDLTNKVIFTRHSLEQIKYNTTDVVENLIKSKPKFVLHIEPVVELYGNSIRDLASKWYIKFTDYQNNLLTTLKNYEKKNLIEILDVYRTGFGDKPIHESSVIQWAPRNDKFKSYGR